MNTRRGYVYVVDCYGQGLDYVSPATPLMRVPCSPGVSSRRLSCAASSTTGSARALLSQKNFESHRARLRCRRGVVSSSIILLPRRCSRCSPDSQVVHRVLLFVVIFLFVVVGRSEVPAARVRRVRRRCGAAYGAPLELLPRGRGSCGAHGCSCGQRSWSSPSPAPKKLNGCSAGPAWSPRRWRARLA